MIELHMLTNALSNSANRLREQSLNHLGHQTETLLVTLEVTMWLELLYSLDRRRTALFILMYKWIVAFRGTYLGIIAKHTKVTLWLAQVLVWCSLRTKIAWNPKDCAILHPTHQLGRWKAPSRCLIREGLRGVSASDIHLWLRPAALVGIRVSLSHWLRLERGEVW